MEQYLQGLHQPYRTDATNAEPTYARNRLRNELLPALRSEFGERVDAAIRRAGQQAGEAQHVIQSLAEQLARDAALVLASSSIEFTPKPFTTAPPLVAREACKLAWRAAGWPEQSMGADEWQRLHSLLTDPDAAPFQLPGGVDARWVGAKVVLTRPPARAFSG